MRSLLRRAALLAALPLLGCGSAQAYDPEPLVTAARIGAVEDHADRIPDWPGVRRRQRARHREIVLLRALALRKARDGEWSVPTARVLRKLAENAWILGRREDAHGWLIRAHETLKGVRGSDDPETIQVAAQMAESLRKRNYATRAVYRQREGWKRSFERTGPYDPDAVPDHMAIRAERIGTHYYRKGWYRRAAPLFRRALKIWEKALGPDHPRVHRVRWRLAKIAQMETAVPENPRTNMEFMQRCTRLKNLKSPPLLSAPAANGPHPTKLLEGWERRKRRPL